MVKWENARSFVELAFAIDKLLPGYVDAYFGPPELRKSVDAKEKPQLQELSSTLDRIIDTTYQEATLPERRREYLTAELKAMQTTMKIIKGEKISIIEETQGLYGLTPNWTDESVFENAHRELDSLLPGSGSIAERMEDFRNKTIIPGEKLETIVINLAADFQSKTLKMTALPEDEKCKFSFVQDKPWSGYNWYLGKYSSRIDINTDFPTFVGFLPHLIAHESYPGHHCEHAVKEKELYQEREHLEHSILLSNTPSAVISEGIAENALEIVTTPEEIAEIYQNILHQADLKDVNGNQIHKINEARLPLGKVSINRILLLHGQDASDEDVIDYGIQYALINEKRSRKSLEFLKDPLWRSYGSLYPLGYELVQNYINRGTDKKERFLMLLQEPLTTTHLVH